MWYPTSFIFKGQEILSHNGYFGYIYFTGQTVNVNCIVSYPMAVHYFLVEHFKISISADSVMVLYFVVLQELLPGEPVEILIPLHIFLTTGDNICTWRTDWTDNMDKLDNLVTVVKINVQITFNNLC